MEILERKIIGTGKGGRILYFQLPLKWHWSKQLKKGDIAYLVLTPESITMFTWLTGAKRFMKLLKQMEKKEV